MRLETERRGNGDHELRAAAPTESSASIRARVERARQLQRSRGFYNSQMPAPLLRKLCALDEAGEWTLEMAVRAAKFVRTLSVVAGGARRL